MTLFLYKKVIAIIKIVVQDISQLQNASGMFSIRGEQKVVFFIILLYALLAVQGTKSSKIVAKVRKWNTNLTGLFLENYDLPQFNDAFSSLRLGIEMFNYSEFHVGWASLKHHSLQSLNHAISHSSKNSDIILQAKMWRGIVLRSMSHLDAALKSFQDAEDLSTTLNRTLDLEYSIAQQASTLTALGRLDESVKKYEHLIRFDPYYKLSMYLPLVNVLEEIGNFTAWIQLRREIEFQLSQQEKIFQIQSLSLKDSRSDQLSVEMQLQLSYRGSAFFALFKVRQS